nr:alpha-mannosidase [Actinomycetota bacterium]
RVLAGTPSVGRALAGGFDGVYTYDVLLYDGRFFPRYCSQARKLGLLCAPSVGPGYDARRATPDVRVRGRRHGATYDAMWEGALRARADLVTITSYNEWHEGTQIEPARATNGYRGYDGAWGRRGALAETAYLERTAYWAAQFAALRG